jgi:hypothetical protein
MKTKSGGGSSMNKNVKVGVNVGTPSKASSPGAANQIGAAVAFKENKWTSALHTTPV